MQSQTPFERLEMDRQNIRERFLIVDGHALIYRAYHAFPELTDSTGMLVNAVYGFIRIFLTILRDMRPVYVAVCFDSKEKTIRAQDYAEYKAHRPEMPDDLKPQIEVIKSIVNSLNVPTFAKPGLEADDLIGSITHQLYNPNSSQDVVIRGDRPLTIILTGDKDLLQLIDDDIRVFIPSRSRKQGDIEYNPSLVKRILGVKPDQIVDLKALMGDSSDNIPGVRGVGTKTATALIQSYATLDGVYSAVDKYQQSGKYQSPLTKAVVSKLVSDRENAYLSQRLSRIDRSQRLDFTIENCRVVKYDKEQATQILLRYGFKSLTALLPKDEFEMSVQDALF